MQCSNVPSSPEISHKEQSSFRESSSFRSISPVRDQTTVNHTQKVLAQRGAAGWRGTAELPNIFSCVLVVLDKGICLFFRQQDYSR